MLRTRTSSPYFSPNSASAPAATASSGVIRRVVDRLVGADFGVHVGFDRGDLFGAQRLGVREIEAQAVGRDQAALLGDVAAEAMAQRGVEQMGRAMVGAGGGAAVDVDRLVERVADLDAALDDAVRSAWSWPNGFDVSSTSPSKPLSAGQFSGVADLPAAFAVEGRLVEDDGEPCRPRPRVSTRAPSLTRRGPRPRLRGPSSR